VEAFARSAALMYYLDEGYLRPDALCDFTVLSGIIV
jgi:hypothetical protein